MCARRQIPNPVTRQNQRAALHYSAPSGRAASRERLRGYREAIEAAGLAYPDELVSGRPSISSAATARRSRILGIGELPTAIFPVNNIPAASPIQPLPQRPST